MNYYYDNTEFLANFSDGGIIEPKPDKYRPWVFFVCAIFTAFALYMANEIICKNMVQPKRLIVEKNNVIENDNSNLSVHNPIVLKT